MRRPNFRGAGGRVAGFKPTDLGNLVLWLPHDLAYMTLEPDDDVSGNADQSGQGNHASQDDPTFQPRWNESDAAFGGRSTITYDPANGEHLRADGVGQYQEGDDLPLSVYWVMSVASVVANPDYFWAFSGELSEDFFGVRVYSDDTLEVLRRSNGGASPSARSSTINVSDPAVYSLQFSGTSATVRRNGASIGIEGAALDVAAYTVTLSFALGALWRTSVIRPFDGTMAEPIMYSVEHSASQRDQVVEYLADKYGITL